MRIPKGNPIPTTKRSDGAANTDKRSVAAAADSVSAAPTTTRRRPATQKNGCVHVMTTLVSIIPVVLFFYYSAFRSDFPVHKAGVVLIHAEDDLSAAAILSQKLIDRKYHVLLATDMGHNITDTVSFPVGVAMLSIDSSDAPSIDNILGHVTNAVEQTQLPFVGYVRVVGTNVPLTPLQLSSTSDIQTSFSKEVLGSMMLIDRLMPLLAKHCGRIILSTTHVGTTARPGSGAASIIHAAVEAMADTLRQELEPKGVSVSVVQRKARNLPPQAVPIGSSGSYVEDAVREAGYDISSYTPESRGAQTEATLQVSAAEDYASQVVEAIIAKQPYTRYSADIAVSIIGWLDWWLPDRWLDKLRNTGALNGMI